MIMGNAPKELHYTKSHEWIKYIEETTVEIGITDYAQKALGDIVFVNLPHAGDAVSVGEPIADVESVKAVSDIYCPVTGIVEEINEVLADAPELLNKDPYGSWIVRISNVEEEEETMTADVYERFTGEEA